MAAMNITTINKPLTEQPFNEIKMQLMVMEEALKRNQLNEPDQREDTVIKIGEMIQEVKEKEIEYTVPNTTDVKRFGGYPALTHIIQKGKAMLIVGLQDLQMAIKRKQDEQAVRIIQKIKINDMYQRNARKVVSVWKQMMKPFETEYKKHKVK